MQLTVLALSLALSMEWAQAATLKTEAEAEALTERIMTAVAKGDFDAAYGLAKQHSVLPAAELDAGLKQSKAQRDAAFKQRYGQTVGYERIGAKKAGQSLLRLLYVEKGEKHPLAWAFFFYRTPDGWALTQLGWDDQAAALFVAE